jgi:hypothetical protein
MISTQLDKIGTDKTFILQVFFTIVFQKFAADDGSVADD